MAEFTSIEKVSVPAHDTWRMTTEGGWTFWKVRTGCIRVQKGDFTAYLEEDEAKGLAKFILLTGKVLEE